MNIVEPYAKMLSIPGCHGPFTLAQGKLLLHHIEWSARISHRSEDKTTLDSYDRLLRSIVLQHGDWSVVEHASVSVDFYVDRGITHEIVRHRLFAFTQESTRFVNYEKKMPPSFIVPKDLDSIGFQYWKTSIEQAEQSYRASVCSGISPQIARSVFPNALASRIIVTGNLRNWRHFLLMRTTRETHPQMRQVTIPLLKEFQEKIPIFYEDIEPLAKQSGNLQKGR